MHLICYGSPQLFPYKYQHNFKNPAYDVTTIARPNIKTADFQFYYVY